MYCHVYHNGSHRFHCITLRNVLLKKWTLYHSQNLESLQFLEIQSLKSALCSAPLNPGVESVLSGISKSGLTCQMLLNFVMNWPENIAYVLLITNKHHHAKIHFIFGICLCLSVGLFMSYICNLFYFHSLIFIVINHKISLKQTHLFFTCFLSFSFGLLIFIWSDVI